MKSSGSPCIFFPPEGRGSSVSSSSMDSSLAITDSTTRPAPRQPAVHPPPPEKTPVCEDPPRLGRSCRRSTLSRRTSGDHRGLCRPKSRGQSADHRRGKAEGKNGIHRRRDQRRTRPLSRHRRHRLWIVERNHDRGGRRRRAPQLGWLKSTSSSTSAAA